MTTGTRDNVDDSEVKARRSVLRVVLSSPRSVWILVIGVFINRTGSYFSTFLALFLQQIGFTLQEMPVILLAVGTAIPIGSVIGGWVSDRLSRKSSLVTMTLLAAVGLGVIGVAPSREIALVGVFIAALFAQAYLPAASALLVDHTAEEDRVPIFAFFRLALNLGAAIGPVIAIAIVPFGLNILFVISCATYVAFAVVMVFGLPKAHRHNSADDDESDEPAVAVVAPRKTPVQLFVFLASVLGVTLVYVQYSSSVSLAVTDFHDASFYATLLTLNAVLVILIELPLSSWTRTLPWWIPLVLGGVLTAVGIPLSGAFPPLWIIIAGVLTWTIGECLFSPVVATAMASLSPGDKVGRYQGYLATVQAAGFAIGPAIGIYAYSADSTLLWMACLVVGGLACLGFVVAGRGASKQPVEAIAAAPADPVLADAVPVPIPAGAAPSARVGPGIDIAATTTPIPRLPGTMTAAVSDFARRVPGVAHAAVVSRTGGLIAVSDQLARGRAEALAVVVSDLIRSADRAARCFDTRTVHQTMVELDRGFLFMNSIRDGSCLAVLAAADSDLGVVSYETALLIDHLGKLERRAHTGPVPRHDLGYR